MKRREFLPLMATLPVWARPGQLKIQAVELLRAEGTYPTVTGVNRQGQVQPLHIYEGLRPKEYKDGAAEKVNQKVSSLYVKVRTDQGVDGWYGPIERDSAVVIEGTLRPFLIGKDPLAGEALWDQMFRLNRHSRSSHFMMAISAVDNALWDLRGRYFETPVYRLLGGPTRAEVTCYGSCLGFSVELEKAFERARALKAEGYAHQKWFLAFGPGDGAAGMKKNVALVKTLREAVGDDVDLMFDCFMGWDLNYAIAWAKQVEQYRPRWIEEASHVDKMESFVALRRATSIPVATGEHFYGRWEVERFLKAGAIHVCQADPEWCGGVSELMKIATLCSVHDVHLIPHGHAVHTAMHVVAAQSPMTCPLVEYLIVSRERYHWFEKYPPVPRQGKIKLPERPGFGIEFDAAKVEKMETVKLLA